MSETLGRGAWWWVRRCGVGGVDRQQHDPTLGVVHRTMKRKCRSRQMSQWVGKKIGGCAGRKVEPVIHQSLHYITAGSVPAGVTCNLRDLLNQKMLNNHGLQPLFIVIKIIQLSVTKYLLKSNFITS